MANGASRRGIQRERDLVNWYRNQGVFAMRSPASLGAVDVVVISKGERPLFCEVKSTAAGPFHAFGPKDRAELSRLAELAGAEAVLVWHPPRGARRFIFEKDWP